MSAGPVNSFSADNTKIIAWDAKFKARELMFIRVEVLHHAGSCGSDIPEECTRNSRFRSSGLEALHHAGSCGCNYPDDSMCILSALPAALTQLPWIHQCDSLATNFKFLCSVQPCKIIRKNVSKIWNVLSARSGSRSRLSSQQGFNKFCWNWWIHTTDYPTRNLFWFVSLDRFAGCGSLCKEDPSYVNKNLHRTLIKDTKWKARIKWFRNHSRIVIFTIKYYTRIKKFSALPFSQHLLQFQT